ncbi:MAG: hypothetical protein R3C56_16330 [Pirellulaceae bacterium]
MRPNLPIHATAAAGNHCLSDYEFWDRCHAPFDSLRLFESQEEFYWDIPKQADAESRYRWALLNIESSQLAKWEAVEHFFPKQDDPLNRLYAGLASLQLARAQFDRKNPEAARRALMSTLDDGDMSKIVRTGLLAARRNSCGCWESGRAR